MGQALLERITDRSDLAGFEVAVISVPTPLHEGQPDLSFIESAGRTVAEHVRPGTLVILESTTNLGTTAERIDPGNPTFGLHNTPKVTGGVDATSTVAIEAFFGASVEEVVTVASAGEAELTRIIENTFRHVIIALINEVAVLSHALGIDTNDHMPHDVVRRITTALNGTAQPSTARASSRSACRTRPTSATHARRRPPGSSNSSSCWVRT